MTRAGEVAPFHYTVNYVSIIYLSVNPCLIPRTQTSYAVHCDGQTASTQNYKCLCKIFGLLKGASVETVPTHAGAGVCVSQTRQSGTAGGAHRLDWPGGKDREAVGHTLPGCRRCGPAPDTVAGSVHRACSRPRFSGWSLAHFFYFENSKRLIEDSMYNTSQASGFKVQLFLSCLTGQKVERYLSQQEKCNFPCLYDVRKWLK